MAVHVPHFQGNFLTELRGVATFNTAPLVSINESSAKRLLDCHTKDGYIAISPCRGFADFHLEEAKPSDVQELAQINALRLLECLKLIRECGFSFTPAHGESIENAGGREQEEVFQHTFIVYPRDKQGDPRPFDELKDLAFPLAGKYNQEDVLVVAPGEPPTYYKKDGSEGKVLGTNMAFNDLAQRYFTDLHKSTVKAGLAGKPTQFPYVGCYINPAPQCLSEAHTRYLSGEVCLRYR